MPSETARPVPYLDEVALSFLELRIVSRHIGHPWTDKMIGLARKHDNLFIDTQLPLEKCMDRLAPWRCRWIFNPS